MDTLIRATATYRGWGWSDWWNDRYVDVHCDDPAKACSDSSAAYTYTPDAADGKHPRVVYCPAYFNVLKGHSDRVNTIKNDKTGQLKQNVRNMRSQATTTLHKWLHICLYDNNISSEICVGGCDDTKQTIGGVTIKTYCCKYERSFCEGVTRKWLID